MNISKEQLAEMLRNERFPRSAKYDAQWVVENSMGPHPLWLTEWLCEEMDLKPGMRVLDMGCGKAITSIFLAREYGVQVWANDLWVSASDNWRRIREAGIEKRVCPIHAEAHALPYAERFFDAIVCVDAYIYFGTDDLYLNYIRKFLTPAGQLGVVSPGLMKAFEGQAVPGHLRPFFGDDCWSWHTDEWWRSHWARTNLVDVKLTDTLPGGCGMYLQWKRALDAAGHSRWPRDIQVLEADKGEYVGFVRMVARRKEKHDDESS